ncbi:hypothetical protein [Sphingobacterium sp. BIGb0116]|uniref:hypothetical protein n=1 Tax=Sphingobacterium sp. BIGb0116 TaxID=2940619 RepID=UPI0021685279|nr:hypothetical protein [Sphingobacterium sp. BIGb0116]MCS4164800.1 hypothetical protein [Sphingobacterium sp. BIGb0116]
MRLTFVRLRHIVLLSILVFVRDQMETNFFALLLVGAMAEPIPNDGLSPVLESHRFLLPRGMQTTLARKSALSLVPMAVPA